MTGGFQKRPGMARSLMYTAAAALGVSFAGCGCGSEATTATTPLSKQQAASTAGAANTAAAAKKPKKKLFDGWEKPELAVVLSGEMMGYLEPCGCSETQSGGLSKRADLLRELHDDKGWPIVAFDLGGSIKRDRKQTRLKFQTILDALSDLNYSAIALGPAELKLGVDTLLSKHTWTPELTADDKVSPAMLSSNLVFYEEPALGTPVASRTVDVGKHRVGVTAVFGPDLERTVIPVGASSAVSVKPVDEALQKSLEKLESEKCDLLVVLSHAGLDESRRIAKAFPQIDVILSAGGYEDPDGKPEMLGNVMLVTVGHKGKHVGVVGVWPGERDKLKFELVDLVAGRFSDDSEAMHARMQEYQHRLSANRDEIFSDLASTAHPSGSQFTGAKTCGECHTKAFAKWSTTPHAKAFESLSRGRKGKEATWISRVNDPECLVCHVTGWHPQHDRPFESRFDSGYKSEEETPQLMGQQCENCHGPGSRHVEIERKWKSNRSAFDEDRKEALNGERRRMHLSLERAEDNVCRKCHDSENSPEFNFEKYWKEVRHPWRD